MKNKDKKPKWNGLAKTVLNVSLAIGAVAGMFGGLGYSDYLEAKSKAKVVLIEKELLATALYQKSKEDPTLEEEVNNLVGTSSNLEESIKNISPIEFELLPPGKKPCGVHWKKEGYDKNKVYIECVEKEGEKNIVWYYVYYNAYPGLMNKASQIVCSAGGWYECALDSKSFTDDYKYELKDDKTIKKLLAEWKKEIIKKNQNDKENKKS